MTRAVLDSCARQLYEDRHPMRYPAGYKENVRARIVEVAAQAFRKDGLDAVSIPELMKMAGLTHGGFYAHFRNRDELVAEALVFAATETGRRTFADERSVDDVLEGYLSTDHVQHPESGCVLAALGAEARRRSPPVRRVFSEIARRLFGHLDTKLNREARLNRGSRQESVSDEALAVASRMVGAIVLARLVDDSALSARILAAAKVTHSKSNGATSTNPKSTNPKSTKKRPIENESRARSR